MNKNEIVGQSKDHTNSITLINSIGQIGEAIQAISTQMTNHEKRLSKVEDTMRVNGIQEMKLTSAVNKRVISWLGGKESSAYNNRSIRGKVYSAINKEIKRYFGIPRRAEIPAKDYNEAMELIENWELDKQLKEEIVIENNQLINIFKQGSRENGRYESTN